MKYQNLKPGAIVKGAEFKAKKTSYFRGTTMSIAMAKAGIIPAPHMIREMADTALLRSHNDTHNLRPSIQMHF